MRHVYVNYEWMFKWNLWMQSFLNSRRWKDPLMSWWFQQRFHRWLYGLIRRRVLRALRHSEFHMQDDARVFLGQHNFPMTHLLQRTSRVITCTNCSLLRRATAILGATGETGQLMARRPLSAALCIIPQPTLWRTLPSCADVCIINHISYQMHIPSHKYSLPNL